MTPIVHYEDLGLIDYKEAWDYQEKLFAATIDKKIRIRNGEFELTTENYLLYCEHPHVYTLGKSGSQDNLLLDDHGLEEKGASFYRINRERSIPITVPVSWWPTLFSILIISSPIFTNTCAIWKRQSSILWPSSGLQEAE